MLSKLARLLLTASSIAPIAFIYAFVAVVQNETIVAIVSTALGLTAVSLCVWILKYSQKNLEILPFEVKSIEIADKESIGFMLLYLLPLFTDKVNTLNWTLWIPVLLVFGIVTATSYGYHFNPMLGLLRWHFYKVTDTQGITYVLVTKKHIRNAAQPLKVGQLTEYILLDLG